LSFQNLTAGIEQGLCHKEWYPILRTIWHNYPQKYVTMELFAV